MGIGAKLLTPEWTNHLKHIDGAAHTTALFSKARLYATEVIGNQSLTPLFVVFFLKLYNGNNSVVVSYMVLHNVSAPTLC